MSGPLIIIGAARSGTKFLRDLLATDTALDCVPYDVNYVWRTGNESLSHDELDPASLTPARQRRIQRTLMSLAKLSSDSDPARLVEKSVSNGLRIPFIEAVFPNARYLHIVRDGRPVIESSMRLWQAPPDTGSLKRKLRDLPVSQYGYLYWFGINYLKGRLKGRSGGEVWGPRYQGILDDLETESLLTIVTRQWCKTVDLAADTMKTIPEGRQLTVRYDDLMRDPITLERIAAFSGVSDTNRLVKTFHAKVQHGNDDKWRKVFGDKDLEVIKAEAGMTLKRFGFV